MSPGFLVPLLVGVCAGVLAVLGWQSVNAGAGAWTARRLLDEPMGAHDGFHMKQSSGFYVQPGAEHIVALAKSDPIGTTDKVTMHNYQTVYAKHFELGPGRHRVHKMLEIGLGCNTHNGPAIGASARLWRKYFPRAEVWFAEYDAQCLINQAEAVKKINIKAVAGDQADPATLAQWVDQTGGNFDLIIDDGGHSNTQQWQSLQHLFQHALKPGGLYVIEDMTESHIYGCKPSNTQCAKMYEVITQWIEQLMMRDCTKVWREKPELKHDVHYPILPGVKSIECSAEACTITKCFLEDTQCVYPSCTDPAAEALSPWKHQESV